MTGGWGQRCTRVLTSRSSRKSGSWAVAWDGPSKSPELQFVLRMAPGWLVRPQVLYCVRQRADDRA